MNGIFAQQLIWACAVSISAPPPQANDLPAAQVVTFAEAVRIGMERNVDSLVATQEILRARGMLDEARAASLPTLVGSVVYTQLDHNRIVGTALSAAERQLNASAVLTVPLVTPQAWGRWSHASINVDVAAASQLEVHREVAIAVAQAYLAVILQMRLVEVSQHAADTSQKHYDFAHTRYVGGVGNHLDELQADQEFANSQAQLHTALTSLVRVREALGVVMGIDGPVDVVGAWPLPDIPPPNELDDRATFGRPDIRVLKSRLHLTEEIEHDSWLDYLPTLVAVGAPFLQRPAEATVPAQGWQAQLILAVPFFDGGARYGQHKEYRAARAEAEAQLDYALRKAHSEVRVAYKALKHAQDALDVSQRANYRAQDSIALSTAAYREGTTENLQVIDAERRGRDAETAAVMAEDTVRRARLDVLTAAGRFP